MGAVSPGDAAGGAAVALSERLGGLSILAAAEQGGRGSARWKASLVVNGSVALGIPGSIEK